MPFIQKILKFLVKVKLQFLWTIAIILIIYFFYFSISHAVNPSNGFASYYTASRLIIDGENPADFYNDDYFSAKVEKYVPGVYEIYLVNLPTTSLLAIPVAVFDYTTARILWASLNFLLLVLTLIFIIKRMKFDQAWIPFILILFFSSQPLYANVKDAQAYIFIFCFLTFVFWGYNSSRQKLPGIITGLVLILKSAGAFLLLLFAIQKKWKSLLWTLITIVLFILITLPLFGIDAWLVYSEKLISYRSSPTLSVTAYQSVHSFFHHLFIFNKEWNPYPIVNLMIVGKSLTIIFSLTILIITLFNTLKYKKSELAFGMFILIGLIISPASIDYHYVMIFIPVIILIDWLRRNKSRNLWALFIVSFALIAVSIPYNSPKVTGGILALFAYPKLYGALGLWGLSLRASGSSP